MSKCSVHIYKILLLAQILEFVYNEHDVFNPNSYLL